MSFRTMLKHRANVMRLRESSTNGYVVHNWVPVGSNVPVFLDLNFIRHGKDAMWTAEAGRPSDRAGVLFALGRSGIHSGDRIVMTKGPHGTFQVEGAVDEAWRPTEEHHLEIGVTEVSGAISMGQVPDAP